MNIIGIDPGINGAWAVISDGAFYASGRMPTVMYKNRSKKLICARTLLEELEVYRPDIIAIENVNSRPGDGTQSAFNFGVAFGGAIFVAQMLVDHERIRFVTPRMWKEYFGLSKKPKNAVKPVFESAFGSYPKNIDIADAAMIGYFQWLREVK